MNSKSAATLALTIFLATSSVLAADLPQLTPQSFREKEHPRVFASKGERAALWQKIQTTDWAGNIYAKLKADVDPYVDRHVKDPQWICSRLQMHWEEGKHFTDFYVSGHRTNRREGNAPFPTVRVAIGHEAGGGGTPIDKIEPYGNGRLWLNKGGDWKFVPFEETDLGSELVNQRILELAYDASIVYYFTGDKKYAKFAADIFWPIVRGASYQNQLNPNEGYNKHGYLSHETLGDGRRYAQLPLIYDFLHDYLFSDYFAAAEFKTGRPGEAWAPPQPGGRDWAVARLEITFKKYLDNKLTRGGGLHGNWNLNEHRPGMYFAMALDDDDTYKDRKGRGYYVGQFLFGPTTQGNGAYVDVARDNINPETGLWPEALGGYGQGSLQQMVVFGYLYYRAGIDVLGKDPLVLKGAQSFPQIAFPNGRSTCWGDAGYHSMMTAGAESMIAYARDKHDAALEACFTALIASAGERDFKSENYSALFFYVPSLKPSTGIPKYPRVSYDPACSIVFERNLAETPADGLMYTVYAYGAKSGHRHANGMSMELYGRGDILGIDPGAGQNYWNPQHTQYNQRVAAHNCVIPAGAPAEDKFPQDLKIMAGEPEIKAGVDPVVQLSPDFQFSDTYNDYQTGKVAADQRRVMGIVRNRRPYGYYVDIYRSKLRAGAESHHDYLYHNIGVGLTLRDSAGKELALDKTIMDDKVGPGYKWFEEGRTAAYAGDFSATFETGINDIQMRAFFLGNRERTLYAVTGPADFRYYIDAMKDKRVPTLILRQPGEAYDHPFVGIYEPSGNGLKGDIVRVRRMRDVPESGDLVGIAVEHAPARALAKGDVEYILNATDPLRAAVCEGVRFQGIYGVVGTSEGQIRLYLGAGTTLAYEGYSIASTTAADAKNPTPAKAVLTCRLLSAEDARVPTGLQATGCTYSATQEVMLRIPFTNHRNTPYGSLAVYTKTADGVITAAATTPALQENTDATRGPGTLAAKVPAGVNVTVLVAPKGSAPDK